MGQEFLEIFTQIGIASVITLCIGFTFLIAEVFVSGFGICGVLGIISLILSVVFRVIDGATVFQAVMYGIVILILGGVSVFLMVRSATKGALSKTAFIQNRTALPEDYDEPDKQRVKLVGKMGKAIIDCRPVGRAEIDGQQYEVISKDSLFIIKGSPVIVTDVTANEIIVLKVRSEN